jgi:hypothetical protein
MTYCVYQITYTGNNFPPKVGSMITPTIYIGKTKISKWDKGYCGSVSSQKYKELWKLETKSNFNLFKREILFTNLSNKEATELETLILHHYDAAKNPNFFNMCNGNLKFYKEGPLSEETKQKISETNKQTWNNKSISELTLLKQKNSISNKKIWENKSDQEKENFKQQRSLSSKQMWVNKSVDQFNTEITNLGIARDKARQKRSKEEQQKIYDNITKIKKSDYPLIIELSKKFNVNQIKDYLQDQKNIIISTRTIYRILKNN